MITITKRFRFEMGHRLQHHPAQCRNLHGHSYVLEVGVSGEPDSKTGMVLDFAELKRAVQPIVEEWDHATMLDVADPLVAVLREQETKLVVVQGPPTAESMVHWVAQRVRVIVPDRVVQVHVKLHETADSWVEVTL